MGVKGSWQRPGDKKKFDEEYERIFGKKKLNNEEERSDSTSTDSKPETDRTTER